MRLLNRAICVVVVVLGFFVWLRPMLAFDRYSELHQEGRSAILKSGVVEASVSAFLMHDNFSSLQTLQEMQTNMGSMTVGLRSALGHSCEGFLRIPVAGARQDIQFPVQGSLQAAGLGDVTVGLQCEFAKEKVSSPAVLGQYSFSDSVQSSSGDRFLIQKGFSQHTFTLLVHKIIDPAIVFMNVGATLPSSIAVLGGTRDAPPGVSLSGGVALALTPDFVLTLECDMFARGNLKAQGVAVPDSKTEAAKLSAGVMYLASCSRSLEVVGAIGATRDAPDFTLTVTYNMLLPEWRVRRRKPTEDKSE
jgi:hypothetical protein